MKKLYDNPQKIDGCYTKNILKHLICQGKIPKE